jgi:hypothetical protein
MRAIVMSLIVAISVMALALPSQAAADCGDRTDMTSTPDGDAVAAAGVALVSSLNDGAQQRFVVQVGAALPDGTRLFVSANGLPAGTLTVTGGIATLDLSNDSALPAGTDPVCEIGHVSVTDANGTILLSGF